MLTCWQRWKACCIKLWTGSCGQCQHKPYKPPTTPEILSFLWQVVAESADACARTLLRHCHATKALPRLCSTVAKDRNGKLRQCASNYLLQVGQSAAPGFSDRVLV